jgi:Tfp pilus assembly protein PilV
MVSAVFRAADRPPDVACPLHRRLSMDVRTSEGFSLLEALVAAAVLAAVIGAFVQILVAATHTQRTAARTTLATLLAVDLVETLRATPRLEVGGALDRDVPAFCDTFSSSGRPLGGCERGASGVGFLRRWSVAVPAGLPGTLVVRVRVVPRPHEVRPPPARTAGEVTLATMRPSGGD